MNDKLILPGIPREPDPTAGIALPLMRGFACPVATPFMDQGGPPEGIGCGWSNVAGKGVMFFITIHAEGGFAMVAQLDPARYLRFAENYASIGRQALVTGNLDEAGKDDPLKALAVAHEALQAATAQFLFYEQSHRQKGTPDADRKAEVNRAFAHRMNEAQQIAAKALMIDQQDAEAGQARG